MVLRFLKMKNIAKTKTVAAVEQTAATVDFLDAAEAIQARVSYYLGSSDSHAIFQIIKEAADNGFDEANAQRNNFVGVWIDKGNKYTVWDHGGGMPVDIHPKSKQPAIIGLLTLLHAGGKFGSSAYEGAEGTKGTHGVGIKATNALSKQLDVWTYKNDKWHHIAFKKGRIFIPLNTKTKPPILPLKITKGTILQFTPELSFFDTDAKLSIKAVKDYLELQSFLHPTVKVYLKTPKNEYTFQEKDGLKALLTKQIEAFGEEPLGKSLTISENGVYAAFCWTKNSGEHLASYVSGSLTKSGGTHVKGLNNAIRDAIKPYKGKLEFDANEIRDGLVGTINVSVKEPKFTSQSKEELASEPATELVYGILKPALDEFFKSNKTLTKLLVQRAADLHKTFAKFTADRKSIAALKNKKVKSMLSAKLARAKTKDYKRVELFLVEGDSAGGCFVGSTSVQLINGETKTLKQLVQDCKNGIVNYGYAHSTKQRKVKVVAIDEPRLVKYTKYLTEVTLDNGEIIKCTRDHQWKLRNNTYCEAQNLEKGISLMPHQERICNYKDLSKRGRRQIYQPGLHKDNTPYAGGKWIYVYQLAAMAIPKKEKKKKLLEDQGHVVHIHHKDFDRKNDHPENLQVVTNIQHGAIHAPYTQFKAGKDNIHAILLATDKQYFDEVSANSKKHFSKYWSDEKHRKEQSERTAKHMSDPANRKQISESAKAWWDDDKKAAQAAKAKKDMNNPEIQAKRRASLLATQKRKFLDLCILCSKLNFVEYHKITIKAKKNGNKRPPKFLYWKKLFNSFAEFKQAVENHKQQEAKASYNHKVVNVRNITLKEAIPVYDASVSKYHNYALAAGVYVHNTAKNARNKEYQAVLPLKGKILNAYRASAEKFFSNEEVQSICMSIGYEKDGKDPVKKLQVGRIVMLADPDVDGKHITNLMLSLFQKELPELYDQGRIFVVDAPLFYCQFNNGKKIFGSSLADVQNKIKSKNLKEPKQGIQRIKGWGEVDSDILEQVAFDPKTRSLTQLSPAKGKDNEQFVRLVGADSAERKILLKVKNRT